MLGAWCWTFLGAAIVVPQAAAWLLRRFDSRLAGPVSSITSIIFRAIAGLIFLWLAFHLATGYAFWVVVPAALFAGLGVSALCFTFLYATAALYVALGKTTDDDDVWPRWIGRLPSGRKFLAIPLLGGPIIAVLVGIASHYG